MNNQPNDCIEKIATDPNTQSLIVLATYKDKPGRTSVTLCGSELDLDMMLNTLFESHPELASVVIASAIAGNSKVRNEVTTMMNEFMKRGVKNND